MLLTFADSTHHARAQKIDACFCVPICLAERRMKGMKTIVSVLVALSVLAGVAGSVNALDAKQFWDEHPTSGER
jgi:hypothetical protein